MNEMDALRADVERLHSTIRTLLIDRHEWDIENAEHKRLWDEMVAKATKLHRIVRPRHRRRLIENRGLPPDHPEFYDQLHCVGSLLRFMRDPTANDDPVDQTIGHEFEFRVFSNRWGHSDTYKIKRMPTGWTIGHISINGDCDTYAEPYLFRNLDQDYINYPKNLGGHFDWLWRQAEEGGLSHEEVQTALNQLAEWVRSCERNSPSGDVWDGY